MPTLLRPDRLLPTDPGVRALARRLYETVRDLPILLPHGHVDARLLVEDEPFGASAPQARAGPRPAFGRNSHPVFAGARPARVRFGDYWVAYFATASLATWLCRQDGRCS
ncbi:hypothetical protein [Actinomadura sp. GTD37]|uniref:hypothetical protein n=1 Tax=Actinomadura sp. GTD37 TaxID=1778030 RepID=UPI0035C0685C